MTLKLFLIVLILKALVASALESPEQYSEGSCSRSPPHPVKAKREIIDSFKYIIGGARFSFHFLASVLPNFSEMTDEDIKFKSCHSRNTTTTLRPIPPAAIFGYGKVLFPFQPVLKPGIYFEVVPRIPGQENNTVTDVVTLTDQKSFAVIRSCLNSPDRRTWVVVSKTPKISAFSMHQIKAHVASMGFKNNFFLDFDECPNKNNPDIVEW